MRKILKPQRILAFLGDDEGATAVEYAVMLGLILVGIIATVSSVGGGSGNLWEMNANELGSAMNAGS